MRNGTTIQYNNSTTVSVDKVNVQFSKNILSYTSPLQSTNSVHTTYIVNIVEYGLQASVYIHCGYMFDIYWLAMI